MTGYLVSSFEGAAFRIQTLLENRDLAQRMGEEGREHVRRNFLITRNLRQVGDDSAGLADFTLPDPAAVVETLERIDRHFSERKTAARKLKRR